MITADNLKRLSTLDHHYLTGFIQASGYKKDSFKSAKFLGLTNGNQFCYFVTYVEDGNLCNTKVFATFDPASGKVSVDY